MKNNCIKIIDLNYLDVFNNFNLEIQNNKFTIISGSNNCGKTTLIRIIDGQIKCNGTILLYDKQINDYKLTEIGNLIKTIIPKETTFTQNKVEEELDYQLSELSKEERLKRVKEIAKKFKISKFLSYPIETLSEDIIIRLQLALAVINSPKIILIDDLFPYYKKQDLLDIVQEIKKISKSENITILMMTNCLDCALISDYIYVINTGKIVIEGEPLNVLEKDNILNKAGLNLPFMIDLSVKLRDYDLIKNIELDMDRMVDTLWN